MCFSNVIITTVTTEPPPLFIEVFATRFLRNPRKSQINMLKLAIYFLCHFSSHLFYNEIDLFGKLAIE